MKGNDFEFLKKNYGERFAKMCRTFFPSILENNGVLSKIIFDNFAPNRSLFEDLQTAYMVVEFKNLIYKIYKNLNIEQEENKEQVVIESPFDLMEKVGYKLYECKSHADVLSFEKYWKENEQLCTFRDTQRIKRNKIFFAVKNNAEQLKRENFSFPKRQDEYGTSVISIQFSNCKPNTISIKNRYNHSVLNPDATFSNDLENIYPGLTASFANAYDLNFVQSQVDFELPNYVMSNDGRYYKYNFEFNNVNYCPDNVVIDNGQVKQYDKTHFELVDYFLIDKQKKTIVDLSRINDSFCKIFSNILSVDVAIKGKVKVIKINSDNGESFILANKNNQIIGLINNNCSHIEDYFLFNNETLKYLTMKKVETIGNSFLTNNTDLEEINTPRVKWIGNSFLELNRNLKKINFPNLEVVKHRFLHCNDYIKELDFPNLEYVGYYFMSYTIVNKITAPKLQIVGDGFLSINQIEELYLPSLQSAGIDFMNKSQNLKHINLPKLESVDSCFLCENVALQTLNLPNLKIAGHFFCLKNNSLKEINLPNLERVGTCFLRDNQVVEKINLPNLTEARSSFMLYNASLKELYLPKLKVVENYFMPYNYSLEKLIVPNLQELQGHYFCVMSLSNFSDLQKKDPKCFALNEDLQNYILSFLRKNKSELQLT